jgi:hypothetical protein
MNSSASRDHSPSQPNHRGHWFTPRRSSTAVTQRDHSGWAMRNLRAPPAGSSHDYRIYRPSYGVRVGAASRRCRGGSEQGKASDGWRVSWRQITTNGWEISLLVPSMWGKPAKSHNLQYPSGPGWRIHGGVNQNLGEVFALCGDSQQSVVG